MFGSSIVTHCRAGYDPAAPFQFCIVVNPMLRLTNNRVNILRILGEIILWQHLFVYFS